MRSAAARSSSRAARASMFCLGGLALGGGVGYHTRWAGLTADHMLSTTMITASGEIVTASADENPDLFWALRGGTGGTFGVNTEFTFSMAEVPADNVLPLHLDRRRRRRGRDVPHHRRPHADRAARVHRVRLRADRPDRRWARRSATRLRSHCAASSTAARPISATWSAPILATNPATVTITPQPFWDTAPIFTSEESENHARGDYSKYADKVLPEDVVVDLVDTLVQAPARDSISNARSCGCSAGSAARTPRSGAPTPPTVHRTAKNMLRPSPVWSDLKPELGQELREWTNEIISILDSHVLNESYQNFPNRDIPDWQDQYFGENLERLVEVKTKWDPDNLFRSAQSISPA